MWGKKRSDEEKRTADAVQTLVRRVEDLDSALRRIQVEWSDTLDRLTRMAGRIAKRAERAQLRLEPVDDDQGDAPMNGAMTPAQVEVAKRRSRAWPGGGRST